jgi:hypothetical protein
LLQNWWRQCNTHRIVSKYCSYCTSNTTWSKNSRADCSSKCFYRYIKSNGKLFSYYGIKTHLEFILRFLKASIAGGTISDISAKPADLVATTTTTTKLMTTTKVAIRG